MVETRIPAQRIDLTAATSPSLGLSKGLLWFDSVTDKLFIYNGAIFRQYAEQAEITTLNAQITALTGDDIGLTDNFTFSNATDVQAVFDDVQTNIYLPFLDEHNTDGTHGPQVTIDQTNNAVALIVDQTTAAAANVINVTNAGVGSAISIIQNGAGIALNVNKTNVGVGNVIDITNAGSGRDIDGNASNWFVASGGAATFTSISAGGGAVGGGAATFGELNTSGGKRNIGSSTELTISAGSITVTQQHHTVDTEADAASDNLDSIVGGVVGDFLVLCAENDARTINIRNNQGIGVANIFVNNTPRPLNTVNDIIVLFHNGSNWVQVAHSNNS